MSESTVAPSETVTPSKQAQVQRSPTCRCAQCTGVLNPDQAQRLSLSGKRVHEFCKPNGQARDESLFGLTTTEKPEAALVPARLRGHAIPTRKAYGCLYDTYWDPKARKRYMRRVNMAEGANGATVWFASR